MDGARWWRRVAALVVVAALLAAATPARAVPSSPPVPVTYRLPLPGPPVVLRGFDDVGRYQAGHRGVDLALSPPGGPVLSAAAGTVTFAGSVAGRGVVVVRHADGLRTSYEPVTASVRTGAVVAAGEALGRVTGVHGTSPPGRVLHWGARTGEGTTERYVDPLALLAPLGPVRLLPWDRP